MSGSGRPLLSVVMPVYNVAAYLPACLDSVLGPAGCDLEVIAVDDASADGSAAILDDRAAADPRLRVVHLPANGGQGPARNAGLALAAGEYVWFVDGDDYLAPAALTSITSRLTFFSSNDGRPDVVLLGWASQYPDGRTEPAPGADLLAGVPPGGTTLAEQPRLIELTMTVWSKLLRREFLARLGVNFAAGIHEDVVMTCAALLAARSIAAAGTVCYCYRRDRRGSAMATSAGHGAVFAAWAQVLDRAGAGPGPVTPSPPVTDAVRGALFERAIWHYATVLDAGRPGHRLVPRDQRRRFFVRMHAEFTARKPAGYRAPAGARGIRFRLIERGWYPVYALAGELNRLRLTAAAERRRATGP